MYELLHNTSSVAVLRGEVIIGYIHAYRFQPEGCERDGGSFICIGFALLCGVLFPDLNSACALISVGGRVVCGLRRSSPIVNLMLEISSSHSILCTNELSHVTVLDSALATIPREGMSGRFPIICAGAAPANIATASAAAASFLMLLFILPFLS